MIDTDILISGGGIAGLTAAAAFGQAGFRVTCVDPTPPVTDAKTDGADLRTTAFLQPARDFLRAAGVWNRLAPFATPLQVMRIVDAGGVDGAARVSKEFRADEISDEAFGWNLPNWLLRREILGQLGGLTNVEFRAGVATKSLFTRTNEARVGLTDGSTVRAKLVIAADGRESSMRQAAGIGVKTTRFGQKAIVFAVTHPTAHDNVSTEIHRSGGPFTLVPLPDHDGRPCSAVVWMDEGPKTAQHMALNDTAFEEAITNRSSGLYGPLKLASKRSVWPIIAQYAERLTAERLALVAEAAHVVPPIGAQGLNMSLNDMASLLELAQVHRADLGGRTMLDAYHTARFNDIRMRVAGITALNSASMAEAQSLRDLRAVGLNALYSMAPVRKGLMQLGLGARKGD